MSNCRAFSKFRVFLCLLSTLVIASCGGGGGGNTAGGSPQITYSGNTSPAILNAENAKSIVATVMGQDSDYQNAIVLSASSPSDRVDDQQIDHQKLTRRLSRLAGSATKSAPYDEGIIAAKTMAVAVAETVPCESGNVTYDGTLDENGRGTLNLNYLNCVELGDTINGRATLKVDRYDFSYELLTDFTATYSTLTISGSGFDYTVSGTIRLQSTIYLDTEVATQNLIVKDNLNNRYTRLEGVVTTWVYDDLFYPSSYTLSSEGRFFDDVHGYVDVTTLVPWSFDSLTQENPNTGGKVDLTDGSGNTLSVTATSDNQVVLAIDIDGVAGDDAGVTLPWDDLTIVTGTNSPPIADAGDDRTIPVGWSVLLSGKNSSDAEFDFLSYQWQLTSTPSGSNAEFVTSHSEITVFRPDIIGSYQVTLRVSDGELSASSDITLTVTNNDVSEQLEPWVTHQGNASHTGFVPLILDVADFSERWVTTFTGSPALNPVATGDFKVYATTVLYSQNQSLYVIDAETGDIDWQQEFGDIHSINPPAYQSGTVYVQTGGHDDSYLYSYDAIDATLNFRSSYENQWSRYYAPTPVVDAVYLAGGGSGGSYRFNATTGAEDWFVDLNQYDQFTPAVNDAYVIAYTGDYDPKLSVIERDTGLVAFEIPDPKFDWNGWSMNAAPVIGYLNNVIAVQAGRLINFDLSIQTIGWEIDAAFSGQPAVAPGVIYAINSGALEARAETSGALLWSWVPPTLVSVIRNIVLTKTHAFVGTHDTTYAVDLSTHNQVWSYAATGHLALGEEGALFISTSDGRLIAINVGGDSDGDGLPGWWERRYLLDDSTVSDASTDQDGDGLSALAEFTHRTNPLVPDSDDDGLSDGDEVSLYSTDPLDTDTDSDSLADYDELISFGTNPNQADSDADGIDDAAELNTYGTDPNLSDSDGDTLPDGWEVTNGLNPLVDDANNDPDSDGLDNLHEQALGTDPQLADTDMDGLPDGFEVNSSATDPLSTDTDGDRMSDSWELDNSLDPLLASDASIDTDLDGHGNLAEFLGNSDPQDALSFPAAQPWSMYQGGPEHSGYVPVVLDSVDFTERWVATYADVQSLNPVVAGDGKVFATSKIRHSDQRLLVIDSTTGSLIWERSFGSIHSIDPPSYENGVVYLQTGGSDDSFLWAFNANNEELVFRSGYGNQWSKYFSPTLYDGSVYLAGGTYGGAYAFSQTDGAEQWFIGLNQYDQFTPAVDDDFVYAYTGDYSPKLSVIDRTTGNTSFEILDPDFDWNGWSMDVAPVLGSNGDVIVTQGGSGRLISFDLLAKDIGWQVAGGFTGQPSLALGVIYAINDGAIQARDQATGSLLWSWAAPGSEVVTYNLIVTSDQLFLSTESSTYAIDLTSHLDVWSYPKGGDLSLSEGVLYIAGVDGTLVAVDLLP
ncbi:MAG: PQQ-binding-like beta-propeller repeat protein [Halopseudomonas sp.]